MAGMRELADHILAVARRNDLPVTNLQIQKVMFFAMGFHIRNNGVDDLAIETYDVPFEKWKYGPVVESLYYSFSNFRDGDITEDIRGEYSEEYSAWDMNIIKLLRLNVFNLVKVSHDLPSWKNFEEDIINRRYVNSYKLSEIAKDFST